MGKTELTLIHFKEATMTDEKTKLLGSLIGEVVVFFLDGWFAKLIWNGLIVNLLQHRVDPLTYGKALLLTILSGILFKTRTVKVRES